MSLFEPSKKDLDTRYAQGQKDGENATFFDQFCHSLEDVFPDISMTAEEYTAWHAGYHDGLNKQ